MLKSLVFIAALSLATAASADTILNDPTPGNNFQIDFFEPIGQSFTAIDSQLLSIGFRFGRINPSFPADPIRLDLYTGTGTGGTLLASRTLILPNNVDYSFFTDFDFTGTALTVGSTYSAALTVVGSSPLTGIAVDTGNNYAGGVLFSPQAGIAQCANGRCDLNFRVIGRDGGAVPEPATWAMMVGGFGLLGAAARRRAISLMTHA